MAATAELDSSTLDAGRPEPSQPAPRQSATPSAAPVQPAPPQQRTDVSLLPSAASIPGWSRDGEADVYTGPELYEKIDGGAEIFYEHGFERLTAQRYRRGADEVDVELYALRDAAGALGIYLSRCGEETRAPGLAARHTAGRHELLLVRGRFYAVVSNLTGRAEVAPALADFARGLLPQLPPDEPVPVLDLLPGEGRVAGSERLIRGPLGLQPFVTLGEDDILQLGGRVVAAAASYAGAGGRSTLVLVPYPDERAARTAFDHLLSNLDPEIKVVAREPSRLVFRDYAGKYGEAVLEGSRLTLRLGLEATPRS